MPDVAQLSDLIARGGVIPVLVAALVVLGREVQRERRERRRWQNLALSAMTEADRTTGLAEFFRGAE